MLGTAYVPDAFPLYYDAVNEKGLCMAGLHFPKDAVYSEPCDGAVSPFELIPWVLAQCGSVDEACELLQNTPIAAIPYNDDLPLTPLHWFLADDTRCVAVEATVHGVQIKDNPVGVLTNSPPLEYHLKHLADYTQLSPFDPPSRFAALPVELYSRGMGTIGLPGDFSSASRFVRAAYTKWHSVCDGSEAQSVTQVFHILDSVAHPRGSVVMPDGKCEITVYSCCCNLRTGVYYYKTYNGSGICAVSLRNEVLEADALSLYPMIDRFDVMIQN